jgi:hypothetical protein
MVTRAVSDWPVERRVALHAPHPNDVEVIRDAAKLPRQIRYTYTGDDDQTYVEVQELGDDGLTYFWTEDSGGDRFDESSLNLGGRFTIQEIAGPPLISQSIRQQQDGLNYLLTIWLRGLQYAGFLEDIITNGLPPGTFDEDGTFIPAQQGLRRGPGATQWISGRPILDPETGSVTGYTTPAINTKQPVDVTSFDTTVKAQIAGLYEEFGQAHILGADTQLSGVSRVQLRQDFVLSCQEDAAALRIALSDLFACTLLLVGQASPDIRIAVEPRLAIAEPLPEEKDVTRADYEADLLSQHTAMARNGVDDPDAEIERINEEKKARMEMAEELGLNDVIGEEDNGPDSGSSDRRANPNGVPDSSDSGTDRE